MTLTAIYMREVGQFGDFTISELDTNVRVLLKILIKRL